jgi:hypothetical protein
MSHTHVAGADRTASPPEDHRKKLVSHFWRCYLEMLALMVVGMIAVGAIFVSIVGLKSWDQVTTQYPTQALLAMAVGMTIPMVGWMRYRRMGRRKPMRWRPRWCFPRPRSFASCGSTSPRARSAGCTVP